jgi:uncharacterized membrane protein
MATLSVWKFPTAGGADEAESTLEQLQKEELIKLHDAAIVSWPQGRKGPKTRQVNSLTGVGALSGSFWGLLFGLLFFVPLLGMAMGAALGALSGSMADVGIDDDFINDVRRKITPGTSALFVLTSDAVNDKVRDRFKGTNAELIRTNLSAEDEAKLRATFAED